MVGVDGMEILHGFICYLSWSDLLKQDNKLEDAMIEYLLNQTCDQPNEVLDDGRSI